ncbi:dihydroorotate dehydrogenase (quinone), partial [Halobacteriales archaeon QH_7_66_37]
LRALQRTPLLSRVAARYTVADERLQTTAFGQSFPNPVGVAAGFDKNAEIPRALAALGFGFVEVGGVTAEPQAGNPRPRMFRLAEDEGLINRMGLNNDGAAVVGTRLAETTVDVPVGVNIAKSEHVNPADAPDDYRRAYHAVADGADFFVVNISCPNSQGFEALQNRESMAAILGDLVDAGAGPLLVKLSPDLPDPAVDDALSIVEELLSGAPIESSATGMVRYVARRTDVPVIGVGGVSTAEDAYRKIRAGASLVQLYTGLIYRGPSVAREINRGLLELLDRDGFDSVADAVGADP